LEVRGLRLGARGVVCHESVSRREEGRRACVMVSDLGLRGGGAGLMFLGVGGWGANFGVEG